MTQANRRGHGSGSRHSLLWHSTGFSPESGEDNTGGLTGGHNRCRAGLRVVQSFLLISLNLESPQKHTLYASLKVLLKGLTEAGL